MQCLNLMSQPRPSSCPRCGLGPCNQSKMNIITKATINKQQVIELLTKAIEEETSLKVNTIDFKTTTLRDFRGETYGSTLEAIEVTFKNDNF